MGNDDVKISDRTEIIGEILEDIRNIRRSLDPVLLEELQGLFKHKNSEDKEVKIDREKNVKFVMNFLNSPIGAHLREKILS